MRETRFFVPFQARELFQPTNQRPAQNISVVNGNLFLLGGVLGDCLDNLLALELLAEQVLEKRNVCVRNAMHLTFTFNFPRFSPAQLKLIAPFEHS